MPDDGALEARATPNAAQPRGIGGRLWAGWAASIPLVLLAAIVAHAVPHEPGLGFFAGLRYAVLAPACIATAILAAWLYGALAPRLKRPRLMLGAVLLGLAAIGLVVLWRAGPSGLASAAAPAVLIIAAALSWLVPAHVERTRHSLVGMATIITLGALEAAAIAGAIYSERPAPAGPRGLAFDVSRDVFDVEHKTVVLPSGARIHYVDEGQGPVLLFLHGNPSWSLQWRDLIRGLRGSYRCIALDYPGFGLSQAPPGYRYTPREQSAAVEEFIDQLDLRDITFVMQDWGGPIGLGVAERRPELARGFILGSTWAWPTSRSEPRGQWSNLAGGPMGEFLQINFNAIVTIGTRGSVVGELPAPVAEAYAYPFRAPQRRGIAVFYPAQITAARDYFEELEAGLPRVANTRALIFWALSDPGFPRSDLQKFERAFADHRTVELAGLDHMFFEDASRQMISEIEVFMADGDHPAQTASRE